MFLTIGLIAQLCAPFIFTSVFLEQYRPAPAMDIRCGGYRHTPTFSPHLHYVQLHFLKYAHARPSLGLVHEPTDLRPSAPTEIDDSGRVVRANTAGNNWIEGLFFHEGQMVADKSGLFTLRYDTNNKCTFYTIYIDSEQFYSEFWFWIVSIANRSDGVYLN